MKADFLANPGKKDGKISVNLPPTKLLTPIFYWLSAKLSSTNHNLNPNLDPIFNSIHNPVFTVMHKS